MNHEANTVVELLKSVGFKLNNDVSEYIFGTIEPENYSVGKDHFKPNFRNVFIGEAVGGYYVTSNIVGDYRKYRCRTVYPNTNVANIHGHGKTMTEAVNHFLKNFNLKKYNVGA